MGNENRQVIPLARTRAAKPGPGNLKKTTKRIKLEGRDRQGNRVHSVLKATIIQPEGLPIRKQDDGGFPDGPDLPVSHVEDSDEIRELVRGKDVLVNPPYDLRTLALLKDNSTELGQNIRTMVTNTAGFGWTLRELPMAEETRRKFEKEISAERLRLSAMLRTVHPRLSLTMLRKQAQEDRHSTGNGYLELISNPRGDLVGINHAHAHSVRLTRRDALPTKVSVPRVRPDLGFMLEDVDFYYRFRRFVQVRNSFSSTGSGTVGRKAVWFKEAGDPRQMDWRTGSYADPGVTIPMRYRATEMIHFKIYNPVTPYGVPVWIGNLFSLFGSRAAEEINYNTLSRNNVPSMFVIVENGALTESSLERLQEFVEAQISTAQNYSKFILLEGESLEEGSPNPESFRIKVEPLTNIQKDDQLFQAYDANNRDKVRQSFRLPPLFVGRAEAYNRATADTSRDIADEQVFAPERSDDDHLINRFILARWGARFHQFRSNHPNITDDIELIRMMTFAEKSGGMTPRRADRIVRDIFGDDIGPLPDGIDLDRPFSLQFAEAQASGRASGGAGGARSPGDISKDVVSGLVDLRKSVEAEIDARALMAHRDVDLLDTPN